MKWKIFAVSNYILLLLYGFLFYMAVEFSISSGNFTNAEIHEGFLLMSVLLIVFLNSLFNIYIFHKHLPNKPLRRLQTIFLFFFNTLYGISLIIILLASITELRSSWTSNDDIAFIYFLSAIVLLTLILGTYIFIMQFFVTRAINQKVKTLQEKIINDIGH